MSSIAAAKHRKKEPEAQASTSGKPFTWKNPEMKGDRNYVAPLVIKPTERGTYQLPA